MTNFEKIEYLYGQILLVNDEPIEAAGLSKEYIARTFSEVGLTPVKILIDLYEWRNGIGYLNAFLSFLSLDDAISTYLGYKKTNIQQPNLFPVIDINGDVQICIDVKTSSLTAIDLEGGSITVIADHYENHLNALVDVFQNRLYFYDENSGSIEVQESAWRDIAQRHGIIW